MDNWPDAAVAVAGITMVLVIASVAIWQVMRTAQVKLAADGRERIEAQYRQAIADGTAAQQVTAARLAELSEGVQELRTRVAAIEKLLREVE